MAIDINARGMIESSKNDISQLFDITKGGEIVNNESSYSIDNAVDYPLLGLSLFGKSTQDGTPTPDNPVDIVSVGDGGAVEITACGKNLYEGSQDWSGAWISNSHWETADEKYLGLAVKKRKDAWTGISKRLYVEAGKTYTFSCFARADAETSATIYVAVPNDAQITAVPNDCWKTITITTEWERYEITYTCTGSGYIRPRMEKRTTDDIYLYLCGYQLEVSNTATNYEPYKDSTATITTALPLCGIPVSEGGNYTDSNGQQWACDELIYNADGTGKIVKRTAAYTITEGTNVGFMANSGSYQRAVIDFAHSNIIAPKDGVAICSSYRYNTYFRFVSATQSIDDYAGCFGVVNGGTGNINMRFATTATTAEQFVSENLGVKIIYQRAEPQEIELTASEISALRQLQTFNGITNISNDSGADMGVKFCTNKALSEYVIPITTGLQKQIDELKAAVISLGGNV